MPKKVEQKQNHGKRSKQNSVYSTRLERVPLFLEHFVLHGVFQMIPKININPKYSKGLLPSKKSSPAQSERSREKREIGVSK